jgi:hypothetical protein
MNGILAIYINISIGYGSGVDIQLFESDIHLKLLVLGKNNPAAIILLFPRLALNSDNKKPDHRPGKSHQYFINFNDRCRYRGDIVAVILSA